MYWKIDTRMTLERMDLVNAVKPTIGEKLFDGLFEELRDYMAMFHLEDEVYQ